MPSPQSSKNYKRKRYLSRKERGLCVDCEIPLTDKAHVRCSDCREKLRIRRQPLPTNCQYSRGCHESPLSGKKYCATHLRILLERQKQKRHQAQTGGLCSVCGGQKDRKNWRCTNCFARQKERMRERLQQSQDIVYHRYGGYRCTCCGETIRQFLSLDHIHGDGNKHRKEIGGRMPQLYKWIIANDFPPIFQVLCLNCNIGRHRNGGICPHQHLYSFEDGAGI